MHPKSIRAPEDDAPDHQPKGTAVAEAIRVSPETNAARQMPRDWLPSMRISEAGLSGCSRLTLHVPVLIVSGGDDGIRTHETLSGLLP